MDNATYITPDEMKSIMGLCEAMDALWDAHTRAYQANGKVEVDLDSMFAPVEVYSGGPDAELLGEIAMTDAGTFGLYFPTEETLEGKTD